MISDEYVFPANPGFVFHDSAGFESGSTAETTTVRNFVQARSLAVDVEKQLHAIWYGVSVLSSDPLAKTLTQMSPGFVFQSTVTDPYLSRISVSLILIREKVHPSYYVMWLMLLNILLL